MACRKTERGLMVSGQSAFTNLAAHHLVSRHDGGLFAAKMRLFTEVVVPGSPAGDLGRGRGFGVDGPRPPIAEAIGARDPMCATVARVRGTFLRAERGACRASSEEVLTIRPCRRDHARVNLPLIGGRIQAARCRWSLRPCSIGDRVWEAMRRCFDRRLTFTAPPVRGRSPSVPARI